MSGTVAYLAVDGGGTRTRFVLYSKDTRHSIEVGPTNVSTDFDAAIAMLSFGLRRLCETAGVGMDDLADTPAYLGLAGLLDTDMAEAVRDALPLRKVCVQDDRKSAVRGALGADNGVVLHAGTGSFVALQKEGALRMVGGWGPALGDEASAHWIGLQALRHRMAVSDGLVPEDSLSKLLCAFAERPYDIVTMAAHARPDELAALAPMVTASAHEGCPAARRILEAGAAYLVDMAIQLGWSDALPVVLTGGLAPSYGPYLSGAMQSVLQKPKASPLEGAVSLARSWAESAQKPR